MGALHEPLPRHIAERVLARLAPRDLPNLARTCKAWHAIVAVSSRCRGARQPPHDRQQETDAAAAPAAAALFRAVEEGRVHVVRLLLELGVDVHADDDKALRLACSWGHADVVRLLLDQGARLLRTCGTLAASSAPFFGGTNNNNNRRDGALAQASKHGHEDVVRLLLDRGADVHARGDVALVEASARGHADVVRLLLDRGADVHAHEERREPANKTASDHDAATNDINVVANNPVARPTSSAALPTLGRAGADARRVLPDKKSLFSWAWGVLAVAYVLTVLCCKIMLSWCKKLMQRLLVHSSK